MKNKSARLSLKVIAIFALMFIVNLGFAMANPVMVRWTGSDDQNSDLNHIIDMVNAKTGFKLNSSNFQSIEERDLANNHFKMLVEMAAGLPMKSDSIRIWTKNAKTVQVEAYVEDETAVQSLVQSLARLGLDVRTAVQKLDSTDTIKLVREIARKHPDDPFVTSTRWTDEWIGSALVRDVSAKAKHGTHRVQISLTTGKVISSTYEEFPQAEFSLPAKVYQVYEQPPADPKILNPVSVQLSHLKDQVVRTTTNPFSVMQNRRYFDYQEDALLGLIPQKQSEGFWAMSLLKTQAAKIRSALPATPNDFSNGGVILEGRYATINLNPDAAEKLKGIEFTPPVSAQFLPKWVEVEQNGNIVGEMIPSGSILGQPLLHIDSALDRYSVARKNMESNVNPGRDPVKYINEGFDEIQVYYAINQLVESLRRMGFSDPELSTRPFNAYLYDPDIGMMDNAYYTDDTINFTTYHPQNQNFARDNSTIWHELGHGIMDRLMGDFITLADTGGLSEGMADFVAALIIRDVTKGVPFPGSDKFRIINKTGFHLTNEVHDDGEAYGGTMKDFLDAATTKWGQAGLRKVTDVTLEAMRLARNHPALTDKEWFNHILFADQLGHPPVRAAGELSPLLLASLSGRNYRFDDHLPAMFTLMNGNAEVSSKGPGSRNSPIVLKMKAEDKATYHMSATLSSSDTYKFVYPVQVRVAFTGGPLQGAINWEGRDTSPTVYTLNSESDTLNFDISASGKCERPNRQDGSCVDYAYVQIWDKDGDHPISKKRFYLRISTIQ